ncbi:MAG: type III-B CRISPR module-associated protein Cmr5 [Candidatus Hydrogenedentes bacterium]|nr:type III-B CRISPR module-associated protein Cmr5 [Candidatus Hydrogenedentota bacterium]
MSGHDTSQGVLIREQKRALHAYECIDSVRNSDQRNYKIAVNDLGANIMRSGLCAALAAVQRLDKRGEVLLKHLASAQVPGLKGTKAADLTQRVRELSVDEYMIATREMLQVAMWLKRASQATFEND